MKESIRKYVLPLISTAASLILTSGALAGEWITGDVHTHTYLTDGSHTEQDVVSNAFDEFRLDFMANSEHGGAFNRNPLGTYWEEVSPPLVFAGNPGTDKNGHQLMFRWQSLRDFSYPIISDLRTRYADKVLLQGVEWNVPSHEHACVGIVADEPNSISEFEYMFDASDKDTSLGLGKKNVTHQDAVAGVAWLQANYPNASYVVLAHPSRKLAYSAAHIRDLNNAGPNVFIGLEGIPGHQKESNRGGYGSNLGENSYMARTYGGVDYMVAEVGGLWDSLLGEGRRIWLFANSDFHSSAADADFYPGEYSKTYFYADELTPQGVVDAMRTGDSFSVTGDLINGLDFTASAGSSKATMGETLEVAKGSDVKLVIRFRSPEINNNGDKPQVNHVDLIKGDVTGIIYPNDPNYNSRTNSSTKVAHRFTAADWTIESDGYTAVTYTISNIQKSQYVRLRGTNLAVGTANETDAAGNPLIDELADKLGLDNAAEAYADMWFYSNPIFITVK